MSTKNILIIVGVIIILILGFMFLNNKPSVSDQLGDLETELAACQSRLAQWQTDYGSEEPRSEEGQEALDDILEDCQEVIDQAGTNIGGATIDE